MNRYVTLASRRMGAKSWAELSHRYNGPDRPRCPRLYMSHGDPFSAKGLKYRSVIGYSRVRQHMGVYGQQRGKSQRSQV